MQLYDMQIKFEDDAAVDVMIISDDEESIEDSAHGAVAGRLSLTVRRLKYKLEWFNCLLPLQ